MKSDLIEQANKLMDMTSEYAGHRDEWSPYEHAVVDFASDAITALSPVLPDDVKLQIQIARDKHAYMLARKPEFGPPDEITANFIGELADLLERQARENAQLRDACGNNQQSIVMVRNHYEQRIEELKAEHEKWDAIASQENERLQAQVEELERQLRIAKC